MPGAEPAHMGRGADGAREVSWVSPDGVNWVDPVGYGHDLAQGTASGGSSRSYVTNVCVKALTMPRAASGGAGENGASGGSGGAAGEAKELARTGDSAAIAGAAALCALAAAACAAVAGAAARRRLGAGGR